MATMIGPDGQPVLDMNGNPVVDTTAKPAPSSQGGSAWGGTSTSGPVGNVMQNLNAPRDVKMYDAPAVGEVANRATGPAAAGQVNLSGLSNVGVNWDANNAINQSKIAPTVGTATAGSADTRQYGQGLLGQAMSGNIDLRGMRGAYDAASRPLLEQYAEQIMPQIRGGAIAAGGMGGSRQGIAEGIAARGLQNKLGDIGNTMAYNAYQQATQNQLEAGKTLAGIGSNEAIQNAGLTTQTNLANAGNQLKGSLANQQAFLDIGKLWAQQDLDAQRANQQQGLTAATTNAQLQNQTNLGNRQMDVGLTQQYLNDMQKTQQLNQASDLSMNDLYNRQITSQIGAAASSGAANASANASMYAADLRRQSDLDQNELDWLRTYDSMLNSQTARTTMPATTSIGNQQYVYDNYGRLISMAGTPTGSTTTQTRSA